MYFLQLYQYERGKGSTPSEIERNIAAHISKSLSELSLPIPPSILISKGNSRLLEEISGLIESRIPKDFINNEEESNLINEKK